MAEIVYDIKKTYAELDSWIAGLNPGTYNVEVDCTGVGADQFTGTQSAGYTSPFGKKLQTANEGVFFNLKPINIDPGITNCGNSFFRCTKLTSIDTSAFTQVTNTNQMFYYCTGLTLIDCSGFTQVTSTENMFSGCSGLTSITGTKAFTNVTDANYMFYGCSGLTSIDTKAFTQVTNANYMFYGCSGLTSIDTKAFTQVTNANYMFYDCLGLTSIDTKAFTQVTNANYMFYGCSGLSSIDTKAFTNVTNATYMFSYCSGLTEIDTKAFTNVTNAKGMFTSCRGLTSIETTAFTNVTNAEGMFAYCSNLTSINTAAFTQVTNADSMFSGCTGLTSIDTQYFTKVTNANSMFRGCTGLSSIDTKAFTNVTEAVQMFCSSGLTSIDTKAFTKVTNASNMFNSCKGLTSIDTKAFTNAIYAYSMFGGCSGLTSIDCSSFTQVTNAEGMFDGCSKLTSINWGNIKPTENINMFSGASAAKVIEVTDQETIDWIETNEARMQLTNYKAIVLVLYNNLDSYIAGLEPGTYNVEVDCTGVTSNQFMGDYANKRPSPFGNKLLQAKPDVFFNIMFNLPNEVVDTISCFDSRSTSIPLKSVEITTAVGLTSGEHMFENCTLLENVDLRSLTSLSSSRYMFQGCSSLKNIDLSPLSQVSDASSMFYNCSGLTTISGLDGLNSITKINYMFYGCTHLSSIDISSFTKVTSSESTFEGCTGLIEVNWGSITPATNTNMFLGASSPKNIKIANKETETWLDSNDLNMKLVNYIINGVIPNNIYIGDLDGLIGHFKNELYRITVNLNNITQDALCDMGPLSTTLNKSVQGAKFNLTLNGNSSIIDLNGFLSNSPKITSITLNDFSNVTDISNLCTNDTSLTSVSLGQLSSVEIAPNAFQGCTSLQEIDISSMENIINISEIFSGCTNLQKVTWGNLYPISYWGAFSDVSENININLTDPDMKDILGGYEMDLPPTAKIGGILKVVFTKIETDKEYITMRDGEKKIIIPNAYYEEVKKPENGISISKWCKDINDVSIEGYSSHTPSCEQKYKDRLASSSFESITFPHSGSLNTNALYKIIIPYSNHREIYDYIKSNKNIIEVEITGTTKEIDFSLFSECNNIRFIQIPLSVEKLKGILPQNVFKIKYMGLSDKLLSDFDNKLVLEDRFIECADKKGFIRIPR